MNAMVKARDAAAVVGPVLLLILPKCPLCLLPLLALAGIAVPPSAVMSALIGVVIVGWLVLILRASDSTLLRACAGMIAGLLIVGRVSSYTPATATAAFSMILLGIVMSLRCRAQRNGAGCSLRSNEIAPCSHRRH